MLKNDNKISREYLEKMVEYMMLSDRKYGVRLDVYVTEEYDDDYENVIGYKLCYIQNDLGLEIVGPAQCLVPFFLIDSMEDEKERIRQNFKDSNISFTEDDVNKKWFDGFEIKIQEQIERIKKLFIQKR